MKFCIYPTKDSLRVADTLAKAKLQDLLHHTTPHETDFCCWSLTPHSTGYTHSLNHNTDNILTLYFNVKKKI
jgi:hypothetical protein